VPILIGHDGLRKQKTFSAALNCKRQLHFPANRDINREVRDFCVFNTDLRAENHCATGTS
jgi:hypothetical protein